MSRAKTIKSILLRDIYTYKYRQRGGEREREVGAGGWVVSKENLKETIPVVAVLQIKLSNLLCISVNQNSFNVLEEE